MGESENPIIFDAFGFWDVSMTPQPNFIMFGDTIVSPDESRQIPSHFKKNVTFGNRKIPKIKDFDNVGKDRARKSRRSV